MKFRHLVSVAAALSLLAVSSVAVAQSAPQPSREKVKGDSDIHGTTLFVTFFALSAIIGGAVIGFTGKNKPASP